MRQFLSFLAIILVSTSRAHCILGADFDAITSTFAGSGTFGYRFMVVGDEVAVVSLGVFDEGQGGLVEPHLVGLWDAGGNLVLSESVDAGTTNLLEGFYRAVDVPTTILIPGQMYTVGAQYRQGSDLLSAGPFGDFQSFRRHFSIDAVQGVRSSADGFMIPTIADTEFFAGGNVMSECDETVEFNAESLQVVRGQLVDGDALSLNTVDNDTVALRKFVVPNQTAPALVMDIVSTPSYPDPLELTVAVHSRLRDAGLAQQTIELYDHAAGQWDATDRLTTPLSLNASLQTLRATGDLSRYRGPATELKMRISVRQTGPMTAVFWSAEFDLASWFEAPNF